MIDKFHGRNLIENLYATMIGLMWPFLYLNQTTYELLFKNWNWKNLAAIAFGYLFVCDDYYTSQKAMSHPALKPAPWRNTARFWLDIAILVCFYGFTMSSFKGGFFVYWILAAYILGFLWCKLLLSDYLEDSFSADSTSSIFTDHITRQQGIYCWCLLLFIVAGILKNIYSFVVLDGSLVSIDVSKLNFETIEIVMDTDLLTILWSMLVAHWLLRILVTLGYEWQITWVVKLFQWLHRIADGVFVSGFTRLSMSKIRENRLITFLIFLFLFAFLNPSTRALIIVSLIMFWYLSELVEGSGKFYAASIASSAEKQAADDPAAVKSAIHFVNSIDATEEIK